MTVITSTIIFFKLVVLLHCILTYHYNISDKIISKNTQSQISIAFASNEDRAFAVVMSGIFFTFSYICYKLLRKKPVISDELLEAEAKETVLNDKPLDLQNISIFFDFFYKIFNEFQLFIDYLSKEQSVKIFIVLVIIHVVTSYVSYRYKQNNIDLIYFIKHNIFYRLIPSKTLYKMWLNRFNKYNELGEHISFRGPLGSSSYGDLSREKNKIGKWLAQFRKYFPEKDLLFREKASK